MVGHTFSFLSRYVGPHGMIAYLCSHHLYSREFKLTFIMVVHLVLLSTCRLRNHLSIMIAHLLLLSRYVGNRGPHLWPRDFKQANECFYSSADPLLPTTAVINREYLNSAATTRFYYLKLVGTIKVYTQIYFFILKLKSQCNIQKTVKIKGCELANAMLRK